MTIQDRILRVQRLLMAVFAPLLLIGAIAFINPTPAGASTESMPDWCITVAQDNHDSSDGFLIYREWLMDNCVVAHAEDIKAIDPYGTMNVVERANALAIGGQRTAGYEAFNAGVVYWLTQQWIKLPRCWGQDRHGHYYTLEQTTFHNPKTNRQEDATRINYLGWIEAAFLNLFEVPYCSLPAISFV